MKLNAIMMITCIALFGTPASGQVHYLVMDMNPSTDINVNSLTSRDVMNGVLYFKSDDGGGYKLWRSDGTVSGTYIVSSVASAYGGGHHLVQECNGKIYFDGRNQLGEAAPFVTDGTASGTLMLLNTSKDAVLMWYNFTAVGSDVFFEYRYNKPKGSIYDPLGNISELWKTDGTVSGTNLVSRSFYEIERIDNVNGTAFLIAEDGWDSRDHGEELWISKGTLKSTELVKDLCPGASRACYESYQPSTVHSSLYSVDNVHPPIIVNGIYYFNKSDGVLGQEIWRSDGTENGTDILADIYPGAGSSHPTFLAEMDNCLYFTADDGVSGMELWKYPLPGGPAQMVIDINSGSAGSEPIWLTVVENMLYFSAYSPEYGRELWVSDGSAAGTDMIEIRSGAEGSYPNYDRGFMNQSADSEYFWHFEQSGGEIYFAADDGTGYELWKSNGTQAGTALVADVNPNANEGSSPKFITSVPGKVFFLAFHPNHGNEWWVYNTGGNIPPIAMANATPTSGSAPLTVSFSSNGSMDPDGSITAYAWNFDDGGSSMQANPTYTYQNASTYTARLTVTDNDNATATATVTITVTSANSYVYVSGQTVTRIPVNGNKWKGQDVVLIQDETHQPVQGAFVSASYSGPNSGTVSGTTGAGGTVTLRTGSVRNPSGDWCFTVTDVQSTTASYNPSANAITTACEAVPKTGTASPVSCFLHQNAPNPFQNSTVIQFSLMENDAVTLRVYDLFGRCVRSLAEGMHSRGTHQVTFEAGELPAGTYIYQLRAGGQVMARRLQLNR